ncbi:MAG TPA: hypothetical protein VJ878_03855, partial [Candidatus Izemoplasmatales bacterium]|nr:hypothetical protein [Candidatus Izemoplasmatales bacterium]
KKLFFREILPLLKTHYPQAFIEANNQLMEIEKRTPLQFDDYNYYHMILNHLSNHTIYEKKRDMIRDLLIDLHKTGAFMKLLYMQLNDGEIKIYHLSKKLLLEKTIDNQHAIYEDMRGHQTKATYTREEIKGFEFVEGTMDYLFVEAVEEDGYLLAYIKQEHYDLSKKLTTLTKHLLKEKINDLTIRKSQKNQSDALRKIMDMNHQAVFKLHHHQMVPLNNSAKQMLGRGHTMMAYHNFQEQVTPMIYIDQLMENKQFDIVFQETDYRLNPVCIEYDVYLMFEKLEKHIRTTDTEWQAKPTDSILLVDIRNHQALTTMLGFKTVNQHLKALIEQVPKLSNMHLKDTIVEANHLLYLLLDTRDKRISERLSKKINSAMGHLVDLRFAYINFNTDFNNAKDKLLDMISQTSLTKTGIFSEKIIRINQEKDQLYIKTIQSMIQSNAINLIDYHVKDWTKQSTQYHYLSIDDLHILKEKKRLRRIFNDQSLAIEFDRLVVNQLIAKAKKLKYPRPWILPLNKASIESKKAFNYLLRRFDILEDHQIIIRLEDASYQTLSDKDKQYLHDKHVSICLENITIDVQRLRHQTTIDYLVIQPDVFEASFLEDMMPLLKKRFKQIIYNHHDQKLFKAKLTRHNIQLIMGAFSGKEKL